MHEDKPGIEKIVGTEEDRPCTCDRKLPRCICGDEPEHDHEEASSCCCSD